MANELCIRLIDINRPLLFIMQDRVEGHIYRSCSMIKR